MTDTADEIPPPPNDERLARLLGPGVELPAAGTGARAVRRRRAAPPGPPPPRSGDEPRSTWRRWRPLAYVLALLVLVSTGAVLTVAGYRVVRDSTAGRSIDPTLDPTDPGFEAFVEPTPTLLLLVRDDDGALGAAALLAAGADGTSGSVVVLPTRLLVTVGSAEEPLDELLDTEGAEGARAAVARRLGIGVPEVVDVGPAELAAFFVAAAPVHVRSEGTVPGFPEGDISLPAEDIARYLFSRDDEADEDERLGRQETVWDALVAALADAGPEAVPGERGAGIGLFLHALATAAAPAETLPATEQEIDDSPPVYAVDEEAMAFVLADAVPFPTAAEPGGRTRVRLLDGTGDPELALAAVPRLVSITAEVVIIGNATSFDHQKTEVIHHADHLTFIAEVFAYALGTDAFREELQPTDSYDVTIVLGADFAAANQRSTTNERSDDPG